MLSTRTNLSTECYETEVHKSLAQRLDTPCQQIAEPQFLQHNHTIENTVTQQIMAQTQILFSKFNSDVGNGILHVDRHPLNPICLVLRAGHLLISQGLRITDSNILRNALQDSSIQKRILSKTQ